MFVSFPSGEQAGDSPPGEPPGRPSMSLPGLCPLPKGDMGRVPSWSTVETLAKCYYPELAHLRDHDPLADYPFPKGARSGESDRTPRAGGGGALGRTSRSRGLWVAVSGRGLWGLWVGGLW